jgi:hypothetical protein
MLGGVLRLAAVMAAVTAAAAGASVGGYHYNAPPVSAGFTVGTTTVSLSGRCAPDRVAQTLITRLDAFDSGRARAFSRGFIASATAARSTFNPYSGEALPAYRPSWKTRPAIERVAQALYRRGDGWTATRLQPPTGTASPPGKAIYGLFLRVTRRGFAMYSTGVKLIVACDSGRITRWNGPIGPSSP